MNTLYKFLKVVVKLCFRIFYSKTEIVNKEGFKYAPPAIIVSNHPNTLIDPLNCAARSKEQVYFLANAGLFATPFTNWLFDKLFCVPIQRRIDTGGKPTNNRDAFEKCDIFLGNGGVLWIAPEGGSLMGRMLHPLKTGSARIGLSAEDKKDFDLNLRIIPVGLNYEEPEKFRSSLLVNVGTPISMGAYKTDYKEDPIKTVRHITNELQEKLRSLVLDTHNETEDLMVKKLEEFYQTSAPLSLSKGFKRTKQLIAQLRELQEMAPKKWEQLHQMLNQYFQKIETAGIKDAALFWASKAKQSSIIFQIIGLIIGFPLFLYGWLNNLIPAVIPEILAKKIKIYPGYKATIKILSALLTFPIFYTIQFQVVNAFFDSPWPWIYLLSLPVSGLFALWYLDQSKLILPRVKVLSWRRNNTAFETLLRERKDIGEELASLFKFEPVSA